MEKNITVIKGDGIGPEIVNEALKVLDAIADKYNHKFNYTQILMLSLMHILIRKTFESLKGLKRAIVHVYNSTSTLQRDVVFHKNKEEIKQIAVDGVKLVKELSKEFDGEVILEYSPES